MLHHQTVGNTEQKEAFKREILQRRTAEKDISRNRL